MATKPPTRCSRNWSFFLGGGLTTKLFRCIIFQSYGDTKCFDLSTKNPKQRKELCRTKTTRKLKANPVNSKLPPGSYNLPNLNGIIYIYIYVCV